MSKYLKLMRKLLPKGKAWESKDIAGKSLYKLLSSLSIEPSRIESRALDLLREVNPLDTFELLTDWERVLGLPDECAPSTDITIEGRRERVIQLLNTQGGQNKAFYQRLAANFGFDIDVIEVSDQPPFRAGISRAGDRLTNGDWRYAFIVNAPADSVIRFRAGRSSAGDRLLLVQNTVLQCLIEKYKPAHTVAIFTFGNTP